MNPAVWELLTVILGNFVKICELVTISGLVLILLQGTRPVNKFWQFMKKHRIINVVYLIMYIIGIINVTFSK